MLVFQAFPLSLSILMRYVLVLPVLLIGLFLYGAVGGLVGALVGLIIPGFYFISLFAVSTSSSIIPVMLGTRFGFTAKQIKPDAGIKKLILPAIVYGAVEALSLGALLLPTMGLMAFAAPPSISSLTGAPGLDSFDILDPLEASVGPTLNAMILAVFLGVCAIRACLLVPIASASIGRDPSGRAYTPFLHFATGFWPLFALVLLSYVGLAVLAILVTMSIPLLGLQNVISTGAAELGQMAQGAAPLSPVWSVFALIAVYVVLGFWTLSLQCAGGVLMFLRLREAAPSGPEALQAAPQPTVPPSPRMSADDLRALRKSRQTGGS